MRKPIYLLLSFFSITLNLHAQATVKLTDTTLMHEMRATPSPLNYAIIADRFVSLQWPLAVDAPTQEAVLDGMESQTPQTDKSKLSYQVRYSQDPKLQENVTTVTCSYPFHNPEQTLPAGTWYWQYGYVKNGKTEWVAPLQFTVQDNPNKFTPPSYRELIRQLPTEHPRILVFQKEWNDFIEQSKSTPERQWYLERAEKILKGKMSDVSHIDTSKVGGLENEMKKNALLTRESRRIVDREEANTEVLIRSYLLTKDKRFFEAAIQRITSIIKWGESPLLVGDFNESTLLSLCSLAYDSFYQELTAEQKALLLKEIQINGVKFFNRFNNHLENHIADNHTWQMTLRILTMAAFGCYGELPEASVWTDYCYNIWLARFPGLNKDGGWHNGDSYFHVNIRTLIEVPYFYSRISGFDFFSDSWYQGSAMYVIYQQPPFSKSAGNGSSHQNVNKPSGPRVGYADALARLTGNTYAADYVRRITEKQPDILRKAFMAKPGDLSWFRLLCHKPLPQGKGLNDLPLGYVFPQTGIATLMSDWSGIKYNAMLTFRSSPYGSTSHAIANQNAFNTFYCGRPLFYSSGHHISFTDEHSVYCHRASRAHNTILVNGMGQRIGTEGYGWIPRHYVSDKISYLLGDASNAYGKVISPLWLERGKVSHLEYSPKNGWDKNHLKTYRRHIVGLGNAGLVFVYDELEADTAVTWSYLLHTVAEPMEVKAEKEYVRISAVNGTGKSDAYLFAADKLQTGQTDQFFFPAVNWLRADDKGNFPPYKNHWHFTATSPHRDIYRFATIISTHHKDKEGVTPEYLPDGTIKAGDWVIKANLSGKGKATFTVENPKEDVILKYDDATVIKSSKTKMTLTDQVPELEI